MKQACRHTLFLSSFCLDMFELVFFSFCLALQATKCRVSLSPSASMRRLRQARATGSATVKKGAHIHTVYTHCIHTDCIHAVHTLYVWDVTGCHRFTVLYGSIYVHPNCNMFGKPTWTLNVSLLYFTRYFGPSCLLLALPTKTATQRSPSAIARTAKQKSWGCVVWKYLIQWFRTFISPARLLISKPAFAIQKTESTCQLLKDSIYISMITGRFQIQAGLFAECQRTESFPHKNWLVWKAFRYISTTCSGKNWSNSKTISRLCNSLLYQLEYPSTQTLTSMSFNCVKTVCVCLCQFWQSSMHLGMPRGAAVVGRRGK